MITDADLQGVLDSTRAAPPGKLVTIEASMLIAVCERAQTSTLCVPMPADDDWHEVLHEDHRVACDWIDTVLEAVGDGSVDLEPAPIDDLVEFVRAGGNLGESPALALLDELAAARTRIAALDGLLAGERIGRASEKARADELEGRIANALC